MGISKEDEGKTNQIRVTKVFVTVISGFQAHLYTGLDSRKCKLLICVFSEVQDTTKVLLKCNILYIN